MTLLLVFRMSYFVHYSILKFYDKLLIVFVNIIYAISRWIPDITGYIQFLKMYYYPFQNCEKRIQFDYQRDECNEFSAESRTISEVLAFSTFEAILQILSHHNIWFGHKKN